MSLSVFVFVFVFVFAFPHVFVIVFFFSIFTMTSMTFSQSFLWHPRIPTISHTLDVKMHREWREGGRGGGPLAFCICDPFTLCVKLFLHSNWKMLHLAKFVYTTSGNDGCGNYKVCWLRCSLNIWRFQCFFCSYWHRCWYYWWWMTPVWLMPYLKHFFSVLSQAVASSNLGVIQAPLPPWQQTGWKMSEFSIGFKMYIRAFKRYLKKVWKYFKNYHLKI